MHCTVLFHMRRRCGIGCVSIGGVALYHLAGVEWLARHSAKENFSVVARGFQMRWPDVDVDLT